MSLATLRATATWADVHPDAVTSVRRSGRRPHRVLMFGGGVLRGLGLLDHNLGLPGHLADALVARSGRGADIDVIVDAHPTSPRALDGLRGLRLRRYDAVIVFVGDLPAYVGLQPDAWRRQMDLLARTVRDEVSPEVPVVLCNSARALLAVSASRPTSRRSITQADRLAAVTADIVRAAGVSVIDLPATGAPAPSGWFSSTTYGMWGDAIATRIYGRLLELEYSTAPDRPAVFRRCADPERPRQRALTQLRLAPGTNNPMLDLIVTKAKVAFRARYAYLSLIDGDLQRVHAPSSGNHRVIERDLAFCDHTIRTDGLTLINDSHQDSRFRNNPLTQGDDPIRFYAGYPIHSWDGYRIGALCIMDDSPRNMLPFELQALQDFAGRIEQEIWGAALRNNDRPRKPVQTGTWL